MLWLNNRASYFKLQLYYISNYFVLQLFAKLQLAQQEIQDLNAEHVRERQELEQTQNELMRELKLKSVSKLSVCISFRLVHSFFIFQFQRQITNIGFTFTKKVSYIFWIEINRY